MAFPELEIAEHAAVIERVFWAKRRPPLHLREKMREGQRIAGQSVELFFVRPRWDDPTSQIEESIAKLTFVRAGGHWRIFWKPSDGKWHRYPPVPEAATLTGALLVVHQDTNACFFG